MVGAVTSCTVTVKLQGAVFPEPSVAVQFTRVSPTLKVLPEAGLHTTVGVPASSVAVAVKLITIEQRPAGALDETLAGQVMTGGAVSGSSMLNGVPVNSVIFGVLVLSKVTVKRPPEVVPSRSSVVFLAGAAPPLLLACTQI